MGIEDKTIQETLAYEVITTIKGKARISTVKGLYERYLTYLISLRGEFDKDLYYMVNDEYQEFKRRQK